MKIKTDTAFLIFLLFFGMQITLIMSQQMNVLKTNSTSNNSIEMTNIYKETSEYIIFYRNHTIEKLEYAYSSTNKTIYTRCGIENCMYKNGICVSELNSLCRCEDKYTTFPEENFFQCTYVKKLQIIAFCLELILMCGLGHFYMGNTVFGVIKMSLFLLECTIIIVLRYYDKDKEELNSTSLNIAFFGCIID